MRYDKEEGMIIPHNTFMYGRTGVNGWYVSLRLQFIQKIKRKIDPYMFDIYDKLCYPLFNLIVRKPAWPKKYVWIPAIVWIPIDDWNLELAKYNETHHRDK